MNTCAQILLDLEEKSYLARYYAVSDHPDLSDVGDLSWDEGDLPHQEIKVAAAFMGVNLLIYSWLKETYLCNPSRVYIYACWIPPLEYTLLMVMTQLTKAIFSRFGLSMTSWVSTTSYMPTSTIFRLF